jgi:hypothetical protein
MAGETALPPFQPPPADYVFTCYDHAPETPGFSPTERVLSEAV